MSVSEARNDLQW